MGAGCELAEAVGCGDSGLGGDHVCADFGYFFEGFEEMLCFGGLKVFEEFGWRELEVIAELRETE